MQRSKTQSTKPKAKEEAEQIIEQKDQIIKQKDKEIEQKVQECHEIIQQKDKEIEQKVQEYHKIIQQKDEKIEQKIQECQQKDKIIQEKDKEIKQREEEIVRINKHVHNKLQHNLKGQQENRKIKNKGTHDQALENKLQKTETDIERETERESDQKLRQQEMTIKSQLTSNKNEQGSDTVGKIYSQSDREIENENQQYKVNKKPIMQDDRQIEQQSDLLPAVERCKIQNLNNYILANKVVSIVVTLKNIQDRPITNCEDSISVKIQPSESSTLLINVVETSDGQYNVSFVIKKAGDYRLVIYVRNQSLISPPFR